LYLIGRIAGGERTGLLAALLFCIYPSAVYWGRMGFANHLLSLLQVASLYCFLRYSRQGGRWWIPACLAAGISTVTEPQGLVVALALATYFFFLSRNALPAAAMLFGFFAVFCAVMLMRSPYFVGDVWFQINRVQLMRPKLLAAMFLGAFLIWRRKQVSAFAVNVFDTECEAIFGSKELFKTYYIPVALLGAHFISSVTLVRTPAASSMFAGGEYYWLGIIGLLFLERAVLSPVVLLFFLPAFMAVLAFGRTDHMLIPIYPFFCLGLSVLLQRLYEHLKPRLGTLVAFALLSYPFAFAFIHDIQMYTLGVVLSPQPTSDVEAVVAYARNNSHNEYIITMSPMVMFFRNATIITHAVSYEGYDVDYHRGDLPKDRYIFNSSYKGARYAVVPEDTIEWFRKYAPGPTDEMKAWNIVNRSGDYLVLENPAFSGG
jgi:hypothetical protein